MRANLTPRQRRTIESLLTCADVTEAARQAKVSRDTVYRWLKQDAFRSALDQAVQESMAALSRNLVALGDKARKALADALDGDSPTQAGTRVRAADIVLSRLLQLRELVSLEERVSRLEDSQNAHKK
jgi:phage terminase small subunit